MLSSIINFPGLLLSFAGLALRAWAAQSLAVVLSSASRVSYALFCVVHYLYFMGFQFPPPSMVLSFSTVSRSPSLCEWDPWLCCGGPFGGAAW
jgi:hypothetical protein